MFTVTFQGKGWFGIGISADGSMDSGGAGSDIVTCDDSGVKTPLDNNQRRAQRRWQNCHRSLMYAPGQHVHVHTDV